MNIPEHGKDNCEGFVPMVMRNYFLASTGRSTTCSDLADTSSEQRTIVNFATEGAYASYMVFEVFKPPDGGGPLMERALQMPHETMVTRRLYAIEAWIAIAGLSIYVAITEIAPRMWVRR